MNTLKEQLTRWIDEDREQIIGFLCDFVRAKSPNPPGDTTLAAAHVASFLEAHQLPFRVLAPAHHAEHRGLMGRRTAPICVMATWTYSPTSNEHWTHTVEGAPRTARSPPGWLT